MAQAMLCCTPRSASGCCSTWRGTMLSASSRHRAAPKHVTCRCARSCSCFCASVNVSSVWLANTSASVGRSQRRIWGAACMLICCTCGSQLCRVTGMAAGTQCTVLLSHPKFPTRASACTSPSCNPPCFESSTCILQDMTLAACANRAEWRWCHKCDRPKPPLSHHCSICETCVLKMDHHCPWCAPDGCGAQLCMSSCGGHLGNHTVQAVVT